MKTIAIPLGRLRLADTNMRAVRANAALEELKASLLVHGQLQPIVVTRAPDGNGFAVIAGARRTLAARALVAEGRWPDTARLAAVCRRAGDAQARELSLAENLVRLAPDPVDEALAFARLVRDGAEPGALAARFGRPVRYVRQRLALAALSPAVLEAVRDERITLAVAQALTLAPSPARQEELLDQLLDCTPYDAVRYVREALRQTRLAAGHALPGVLEAYAAAGGTLTRDLFDGADEGYADDPALFLACQRAAVEREAERLRAQWAFVDLRDGPEAWNWRSDYLPAVPLPSAQCRDQSGSLDVTGPDYDRAVCGVVAVLSSDGAVTWIEGVRRRPPAVVAALADPSGSAGAMADDGLPPWEDPPDRTLDGAGAGEPHLSAAVREELSAVRTASLQAAVLDSPEMALRLACFALLAPGHGPCTLAGAETGVPAHLRAPLSSRDRQRVDRAGQAWSERLGLDGCGQARDPAALWVALGDPALDLPALLALLVARRCRLGHGEAGVGQAVLREQDVSVAAAWRPDADLLERCPKAVILDAARAIAPGFAAQLAGLRKPQMAGRVAGCLSAGAEADWPALTGGAVSQRHGNLETARRAAASWLPPGLAVPGDDGRRETGAQALAAE